MSFQSIITPEIRARLSCPTGKGGTCLPNACYTDPEWLELENERLFARTWMYAGCVDQVSRPGDVFPTTIAGKPVILVHGRDGRIRAFHNLCRHRGAVLVEEPCSGKSVLTCPYHAWAYGLDGTLRTRPHFRGGGEHDVLEDGDARGKLRTVRCESWRGMLFVNIDGDAAPLAEHMLLADDALEGWAPQELAYGGALTFEVAANWKHIHENFIDVYHKFAIHPALCAFAPMETSHPMVPIADHLLKTWHVIAAPQEGRGKGLPALPGLPDVLHREGRFFTMIPICSINVWYDQIAILVAEPTGLETTRETIHLLFAPEAMAGQYDRMRQAAIQTWDNLNREDIDPLESMQRGRVSPGFDGGTFSPFLDPGTHFFARQVAELMLEHENA